MSQEVKEIKNAIDFLYNNYEFKSLILIGHSTGAIDASLYAYKDKRIDKLVLSGAVSDLKYAARYDFNDEQIKDFWEKGYIIYRKVKGRKKHWVQGKKLKKAFYDEFFILNIFKAMRKWNKPLLIIHGEKDEAIPSSKDPYELYKLCKCRKKLVIIKGSDHSYSDKKCWKRFVKVVDNFIRRKV
jgi:pimeloyl-ACP methyl ester carboxylesterase